MRLQRTSTGRHGDPTFGLLVSKDGKFTCVTLERSCDGDHPRIPAGTYRVHFDQHHPGTAGAYRCPELDTAHLDPARSQIQIHIANRVDQIRGCIAVGENIAADESAIEHSKSAFDRLMIYLEGVSEFTLEIVDP
jgi:hypothetical protein